MQEVVTTIKLLDPAAVTALRITLILIAAWITAAVLRRLIALFRTRVAHRMAADAEAVKRAETLGRVFRNAVNVALILVAGMLVLSELGVSVAPILGAAGVVGIAVGFGAQSLVKDVFTGFFILLENQIRQGDVVNIADKSGLVEEITLRFVRLRDYDGNVHYVPNSLITTVTNMSRGFAQSVIDVGISYGDDIDAAIEVMRTVGAELRADPVYGDKILGEMEIAGVDKLADSAVVLRGRFKVLPLEQWNVRREYLRRVKRAFGDAGIEIPFPHLTVYAGKDRSSHAPEKQTAQPEASVSNLQKGESP
jgi:small conductance mechanosensitive channel